MRKPALCKCDNQSSTSAALPCRLIIVFVFRCLDIIVFLVYVSKIFCSFAGWFVSDQDVVEKNTKTDFLVT